MAGECSGFDPRSMNVFIVLSHPEPQSFNAHLAACARAVFEEANHAVRVSDLYASNFDPREAPRHFPTLSDPERFDAQREQRFNWDRRSLPCEVQTEIEKIFWADLVILQFPLWWFGPPAILKGWMDRVFVYGGLYTGTRKHDRGPCQGKNALMCVTTGSSEAACSHDGREGDTELILWPSLYALRYVGFNVLRPFIIHGVRGGLVDADARAQHRYLSEKGRTYKNYLLNIDRAPEVVFNSDRDWDEQGKLRSGAAVYSPFIRHDQ